MGRTVMSIVQAFHHERESWGKFRRALGRSDREAFDRLFQHARRHAAEASYAARPTPFEAVVMTVLLEHEKALRDIRDRLDRLEAGPFENLRAGRLDKPVPSGVEGTSTSGSTVSSPSNGSARLTVEASVEPLEAATHRERDADPGLAL